MGLGAPELIIILILVLIIFGGAKLPKLARSLGEAQKEFKKAQDEQQAPAATSTPAVDEKVTMTKAELDALLAEREAAARREAPPAT